MEFQRTICNEICVEGEGVLSGKKIKVLLEPAEEDTGIYFVREDLSEKPSSKLDLKSVVALEGATAILLGKEEEEKIVFIEHLLSSLHALKVDNLIIRVWGGEIPLFDGSSRFWVRKIQEAGYRVFLKEKDCLTVKKEFFLKNGKGYIKILPSNNFSVKATISFDHPLIQTQTFEFTLEPQSYIYEISPARTFDFKEKVLLRKKNGCLKGGSLESAIILDEKGILNSKGLRFKNEFIRHKILDIIGDFYSLGVSFKGKIEAFCSNHKLHIEALKKMLESNLLAPAF